MVDIKRGVRGVFILVVGLVDISGGSVGRYRRGLRILKRCIMDILMDQMDIKVGYGGY